MRLDLESSILKSLIIMGFVIEARDPYTGGHLWRVARYAEVIARIMGFDVNLIFQAKMVGFLHDLGKVGVPDQILRKEGRLEEDEYETMKTHPNIGGSIMTEHPLRDLVYESILGHHERMDGRGYPYGISGDGIPLIARVISVADAFDAMTSTRPYRKGMSIAKAVARLREAAESQFDKDIVLALVGLAEQGHLETIQGHSDEGRPMLICPRCGPVIALPRSKHDGDTVFCPVCASGLEIHEHGDHWEVENLHQHGTPRDLRFDPDLDLIEEIVRQAPESVEIQSM